MATNDYRQDYRQGPPPSQQRDNDRYDQRSHTNGRQDYMYSQRDQGYNGEQYQSYDTQYEQTQQWGSEYRPEHQYQEQYRPQNQQYGQGPKPQRSYQYDDRYHMNGPAVRQPSGNTQGRLPFKTSEDRSGARPSHDDQGRDRHAEYNRNKQPKARERILQPQPDSPTSSSWDNPFPTFPTKKKHADAKVAESEGQKNADPPSVAQPLEPNRPSTSHGNQQRREPQSNETPRPLTSQSQGSFQPTRNITDPPPMPFQGHHQESRYQTSFHGQQLPVNDIQNRPGPRRVMTGPAPGQRFDDFGPSGRQYQTSDNVSSPYHEYPPQNYPDQQEHPNSSLPNHSNDSYERDYQQQRSPEEDYSYRPQQHYGPSRLNDSTIGHRRQSSDPRYGPDRSMRSNEYDSASYRGITLTKKVSPEVPNFDAISESHLPRDEDQPALRQQRSQVLAYRKPAYQKPTISPFEARQQQAAANGNGLASPLAQFSFELEGSEPTNQGQQPLKSPVYSEHQRNSMENQIMRKPPPIVTDRIMPPSQRAASRPQDLPPNNPYGSASSRPPPFRPGLAQPPNTIPNNGTDVQRYDYEQTPHNFGPPRDEGFGRPRMPHLQTSYHSDTTRQGYDQRIHQQSSFSPHQVPARPATANSARSGPMPEYGSRISSDSYQRNGTQNPDSLPAHPVPYRPGLMRQAPPAPRPTPPPQPQPQAQMHQRAPSGAQPSVEPEPPVTVGELNELRDRFKTNPNDYALGLKFAKRLVEAAKVLASENGRADAKQTAKNRERYILDAHKIVKRLCGSGYPEAMFYLADCYGQGLLGLQSDPKEAFSLYQSAAKLGHPQAAYRVAVCCELGAEEGGGTRRDPLKAVQWYKRAASLGDAPAMYKMGMILLKGLLSQSKSPREAISWLKRAAERADAENPHALHELGLLYENAQSTDIILKDEKYALQLFQQAADLGYKYSQFRLGSAFEYGSLGLPIDPRMSIAWYSRAAKQGEHQSEFALSGWYLTGSGQSQPGEQPLLQQSDTEAYLWARKAASSGLAKAEYAMGYYTEVGIGAASNIEEAKTWYYRAAAQNHPKARERLEHLKKGGQRMQKTRVSRSNVSKQNEGECTVM